MRFQKIKVTEHPKTYFAGYAVGRRAYSAKNLIKPAVAKLQAAPATPIPKPSVGQPSEWVTKEEMMSRLRMGETYFDGLVKRGKIPVRRYSRKMVRFNPVAVEAALAVFDVGVVP
jgi:hypothetical protein